MRGVMRLSVLKALVMCIACGTSAWVVTNSTDTLSEPSNFTDIGSALKHHLDSANIPKTRRRRYISQDDMIAILDYHNKVRGNQVFPPASNMEFRPPTFHIQAWYDEVRDYTYPYSQECDPYCPFRCSGPVCTHYTQVVWATSSRIGCAINLCHNMNVWGQIWPKAIYLVCNYSPKGNWWGHAPYKNGRSCSACPPSYGGGCRDNLCYKAQQVSCETRLRDKCKGTTCNRYECPAGCLDSKAKVIGSVYFEMKSSVCRTAVHAGVIRNSVGGYIDVMPVDKRKQYVSSYQNGIFSERYQHKLIQTKLIPKCYSLALIYPITAVFVI
ncbi:UNVERIFIED_CONTAM: hypothetical protein FKN15_073526 [Acipenser sinensis]